MKTPRPAYFMLSKRDNEGERMLAVCYSTTDDRSSDFMIHIPNYLTAEQIGPHIEACLQKELSARGIAASQLSMHFEGGNATPAKLDATPPGLAERLFLYFGPRSQVDEQLGDLEEIFHRNVKDVGLDRARMRYTAHVVRSITSSNFDRLKRWGVIAIIVEIARRRWNAN